MKAWSINTHFPFFFITFSLTVFAPIIFPGLHLLYFAPFICSVYYSKSYSSALWVSLFCGLVLDLLSAPLRFGLHALNFTLTSAFLYSWKQHFFEDQPTTLPILTFLFSVVSTLIQIVLLYTFESRVALSLQWVITDLVAMPGTDALYAFICFSLPKLIWGKAPKRGKDYFL